jgi:energy-coupling factor transport system ATP-binding protein
MIRFDRVSFRYPDQPRDALDAVEVEVAEGEFCLVVGQTGAGKSTLLRAINGLVPHFTGGTMYGGVVVDGRSTSTVPPREMASTVGVVGQDPVAGFVADTVEDELAYVMENLGTDPTVMRRRVEDALDLLSIADLRDRPLGTLSSGQAQRVAIASVITAAPRVLVLDEPTSALDPGAAEDILAALTRLVHDLGLTIVAAEHRLERIVQYADRIAVIDADGRVTSGDPTELMRTSPVAPPVVQLGRLANWSPLPLSVRDARRAAEPLRQQLASRQPAGLRPSPSGGDIVATVRRLQHSYGATVALRGVDLELREGEVVAVMGRNGAGKSTLLSVLAGSRGPRSGSVSIVGADPRSLAPRELVRRVGLVPSDPSALLYEQSVEAECATADKEHGLAPGSTRWTLDAIQPMLDPERHPRDLSEGERLALALAVVVAPGPRVLLLDEPTRGLDYSAKERLAEMLHRFADQGRAVVLATHDVELVAAVADRAIVLADGEVVSDGSAREVVVHSPVFAPQVSKILAPSEWLTVAEVEGVLRR